jgi:ketosteroid isomerase-like protein
LESAQEAWNAGSVEGVLDKYVDDLVYTTNSGGPNGESLTFRGKAELRNLYRTTMEVLDSASRLESLRYENGIVRTRLTAVIRHRATGHILTCSLRQILRFRGFRIAEQEDFHDAAKLAAFWRLVENPLDQFDKPISA